MRVFIWSMGILFLLSALIHLRELAKGPTAFVVPSSGAKAIGLLVEMLVVAWAAVLIWGS